MKIWLILSVLFFFAAACGIKGPPLPPLDEEAVQKQKTVQTEDAQTLVKPDEKKKVKK